jgi:hypothetical protein
LSVKPVVGLRKAEDGWALLGETALGEEVARGMPNLMRGVVTSLGATPLGAASNYGSCLQAKRHGAARLEGVAGWLRLVL